MTNTKNKNQPLTTFLSDPADIRNAIKTIFKNPKWIKCAVAYWGKGAVGALFKNCRVNNVTIIADVFSGGCNPDELEKLRKMYGRKFYYHERLHAKVYLSDIGIVVGSANASTNGFGAEGVDAKSLQEAVLFSNDPSVMTSAQKWFENLEGDVKHNQVTKSIIKKVKLIWDKRKKGRRFFKDFVESVEAGDYENRFRDTYIVIANYADENQVENAEEAKDTASKKHPDVINLKDTDWYCDVDKKFPYGKNVFGFMFGRKNIEIEGEWKIRPKRYSEQSGGYTYTFCKKSEELPNHITQIRTILINLDRKTNLTKMDTEVIFKITKKGLQCIIPKSLDEYPVGLITIAELRKLSNTKSDKY